MHVKLAIGDYVDYYKPTSSRYSLCDMLLSHSKHLWSSNGKEGSFVAIKFNANTYLGGSDARQPQLHGDQRDYFGFWGNERPDHYGVCCHSKKNNDGSFVDKTWKLAATMAYGAPETTTPVATTTTTETTTTNTILAALYDTNHYPAGIPLTRGPWWGATASTTGVCRGTPLGISLSAR